MKECIGKKDILEDRCKSSEPASRIKCQNKNGLFKLSKKG